MIWELAALLVGVVVGVGLFIGLAYLMGGSLGSVGGLLGKLAWTVASLINDTGTALYYQHGKNYSTVPLREGEESWEIYVDDIWKPVEGADRLQRLGLRPFGIVLERTEEVFSDLAFSGIPGKTWEDSDFYQTEKRADLPGFMPTWFWQKRKEGSIVSLFQLGQRIKATGSTEISEKSYVESLKKYADQDGLGSMGMQVGFYIICLIIGCGSAYLMIG
jgi:hypothetical protein